MHKRETTYDFLLEVGTEELPSAPLNAVLAQLSEKIPQLLEKAQLTFDAIKIVSTPRRIAIIVSGLPTKAPDEHHEYKGPSVAAAYAGGDRAGEPTKALLGFARGKGVDLADIEVRSLEGTDYVYASVTTQGKETKEVLAELIPEIISGMEWKKTQRWGEGETRFVRPIRWLVALLDNEVIPVTYGDIASGRSTKGHRFLAPRAVDIATPHEYVHVLKGNHVLVDQGKRRALIEKQAQEIAAPHGTVLLDPEVLDEVVNLTESPNAILGVFDDEFLRAPREIVEYAMAKHQRYFAIERPDGGLDDHFVIISNGDTRHQDRIAKGHERVVRARLADAVFFYDEDLKTSLSQWSEKLKDVVFQKALGSSYDKTQRLVALVEYLAQASGITGDEAVNATRAAQLAKADLVTNVVIEFPNLQGVMGNYYALHQGENPAVGRAIEEHYRPRFRDDVLPSSTEGLLVSVADKMDTIAGIFAAGKAPRGTSDPFALRRSAIGIIQIALQSLTIDLDALIEASLTQLKPVLEFECEQTLEAIRSFFASRLETILNDQGYSHDVVAAVLAKAATDPADAVLRAQALEGFKAHDDMVNLSTAFTRAKNLADPSVGTSIDEALLTESERALFGALQELAAEEDVLIEQKRYTDLLSYFARLRAPVDTFFDSVMIMDDDEAIRANRIALLNRLVERIDKFADLTKLVVKK